MSNSNLTPEYLMEIADPVAMAFLTCRLGESTPEEVEKAESMLVADLPSFAEEGKVRGFKTQALQRMLRSEVWTTEILQEAYDEFDRIHVGIGCGFCDESTILLYDDPKAPYMPVDWFQDEFGITADALAGQKKRGNLATKKRGRWNLYSVRDAMDIWPGTVTYLPDDNTSK